MKQKTLIEGDENLLDYNEILIKDSEDFECILKKRVETGDIKSYVVISIDDYIDNLKAAFNEGTQESREINVNRNETETT